MDKQLRYNLSGPSQLFAGPAQFYLLSPLGEEVILHSGVSSWSSVFFTREVCVQPLSAVWIAVSVHAFPISVDYC